VAPPDLAESHAAQGLWEADESRPWGDDRLASQDETASRSDVVTIGREAGRAYEGVSEIGPFAGAPVYGPGSVAAGGPLQPDAPHDEPTTLTEVERVSPLAGLTLTLRWPMPATGVTSPFGLRRDPVTGEERFHYGVDLQGHYGQLVQASADGRVVYAGWDAGHGRRVEIQHAGGWRTSYSHLSQVLVMGGQDVRAGQAVGRLGNSGRSTGPHLHLEVTRWEGYFDPLDILATAVPLE